MTVVYDTAFATLFGRIGGNREEKKNLIRLGVEQDHTYAWSRTRKGGWAIAQSPILGTTITLKRLKQKGNLSFAENYIQLNSPLYVRASM